MTALWIGLLAPLVGDLNTEMTVFASLSTLPYLVYVTTIRTPMGSVVVGPFLLVASAGAIMWWNEILFDPYAFEVFTAPLFTWPAGLAGILLEFGVFRPLHRGGYRRAVK